MLMTGGRLAAGRDDQEIKPMMSAGKRLAGVLLGGALVLAPGLAFAQEAAPVSPLDKADTVWMMVATCLVLFMLMPGLALFYGGLVRKINVLTIVMQSVACACVISVVWFVLGYSIAFGAGGETTGAYFGDFSRFFLSGMTLDTMGGLGTIPEGLFMLFQMTFAIITPALITGAFADRMKFSAMVLFVVLWSLLVYAPLCHMVWAGTGWMFIGRT